MCPSGVSLKHPMASLLLEYAEHGCSVDCGEEWSTDHINAAIQRGPHIQKSNKIAAEYTWVEAL